MGKQTHNLSYAKIPAKTITLKESRFIASYLISLNATKAALEAGVPKTSAQQWGADMLRKPVVRAAIQLQLNARAARTQVTADRVVMELARIAFFNPKNLFDSDGNAKSIKDITDDDAAAVAAITSQESTNSDGCDITAFQYKFCDKLRALEILMKHLNILGNKDQDPLTIQVLNIIKEASRKSAAPDETREPEDIATAVSVQRGVTVVD